MVRWSGLNSKMLKHLSHLYLSWSVDILVTNVTKPMKWSKNKQLAGDIFAYCIALTLSLSLLAGFAIQSLLAVYLCRLASTEGEVLGKKAVLGNSSEPKENILVGTGEGSTDVSPHHSHVACICYCTSLNMCPARHHTQ